MGVLCKNLKLVWKRAVNYHDNNSGTINNESSQVLIDPQNKLKHNLKPFNAIIYYLLMRKTFIYCCSSFSLLERVFRWYCVDPLVRSDSDRLSYTLASLRDTRFVFYKTGKDICISIWFDQRQPLLLGPKGLWLRNHVIEYKEHQIIGNLLKVRFKVS